MKKTFLILNLFTIFLSTAQKTAKWFDIENSKLPDNEVWSILADHAGTIWLGTQKAGLIKFDGENFTTVDGKISKNKLVTELFEDANAVIWFAVSNEAGIFKLENGKVSKITDKILLDLDQVYSITQGSNGDLYFGGKHGVVKYSQGKWQKVDVPQDASVLAISTSANNSVAVGMADGLWIGSGEKWEKFTEEKNKLQLATVRALKFLPGGALAIGYGGSEGNGGFSIKQGDIWTHYNKTNSAIPDHMVRDIELDENGNLWMATNNGMIKFSENKKIETIFFRKGENRNTIMDISIKSNVVWVGTDFGFFKLSD